MARFARVAATAREIGFTGIQVHAAHAYLISQFLSPLVNQRTDHWGGSLANRARFLREVVRACRAASGQAYAPARGLLPGLRKRLFSREWSQAESYERGIDPPRAGLAWFCLQLLRIGDGLAPMRELTGEQASAQYAASEAAARGLCGR